MARKRMIDPRIWQSEQIAMLTRDQRLLFIGIVSNADDEGRIKGSPLFLKLTIFPGDMDISLDDVRRWRDAIANARDGNGQAPIRVYSVNGIEYIDLPNWRKYQRIDKPSASDIPPFDERSGSVPGTIEERSGNVRSEVKRREEKRIEIEDQRAADADAPAPQEDLEKPAEKPPGRHKRPRAGPDLAPLVDAFRALGLPDPAFTQDEAKQAQELLRYYTPEQIAECWQAYAEHRWGDKYDWDRLSFRHLAGCQRVGNWLRDKDRAREPPTRNYGYSQKNHI
jgi:hypothetical protein